MPPNPNLKAVFFDIGGVVVRSPLIAIAEYEKERGMPKDWINTLMCVLALYPPVLHSTSRLFPYFSIYGSP